MSFWAIIDTLLFKPLELIFEVVYVMTYRVIENPGLSIIVLSLVMNVLVLPLYKRADAMQEEERDMEMKLHKDVSHIKRTFHGDERMMILQTYYRQNNYKPTYVLRGAISLFLEIPFFIAAYRFLSGLQLLNGVSFGPIRDLGKPDGMLVLPLSLTYSVNILPVIMTTVNLISCIIFTKGSPLKTKIQLYGMAAFFLVFLYSSPSGLVFYWTLNNLFSLVKTIFYKMKNPLKSLGVILSVTGIGVMAYGIFFYHLPTIKRISFFVCCGLLMQVPLVYDVLRNKMHFVFPLPKETYSKKLFFAGCIFLAIITGVLIPSAVISSAPQDFISINYFYHPIWFIVSSGCTAVGIFVIWLGVFYWLAKPYVKSLFDKAIWIVDGIALINYMFFGKNLGILSPSLQYEHGLNHSMQTQLLNLGVGLFISVVMLLVLAKIGKKYILNLLMILIIASGVMTFTNIVEIKKSVDSVMTNASDQIPQFALSKNGKNVIILMLDRAMGIYVPYMFNEKPELKEQFSGFVYYSNVISFGGSTNFGSPALFGGYEYTPYELNKRSDEPLVSKHNEALKVLPVLFDQNNYDVTVCDPTYANYMKIPDLSIYNEYPNIDCYITNGKFTDMKIVESFIQNNTRNFFCYGILKVMPLCLQEILYDYGSYNQSSYLQNETMLEPTYFEQVINDVHTAIGLNKEFMDAYNILTYLPYITDIVDDDTNTCLIMTNDTPHNPMLLSEPDYVPKDTVDNTTYDENHQERFKYNDRVLRMENELQITHYQVNMATMLQLGTWFDYMRENGVYDNTRIILVADHGRRLNQLENFSLEDGTDIECYYPLLMVKDFDSEGFIISDEFMTNGDVPALATDNLIKNPVNPFTGKLIDSSEKTAHDQYVIGSVEFSVSINNGNQFLPSQWYSVHDDMRVPENWKIVLEEGILPEE